MLFYMLGVYMQAKKENSIIA